MEIKHPSYYKKLAKKEKRRTTDSRFVWCKRLQILQGKGTYTEPDKDFPGVEYIEDCEHCNGTGSE